MPPHQHVLTWLAVYVIIGWGIRIAMVPVILRRLFAPGAALAWLGIIFLHPYIGLVLYLTLGEKRLGRRRKQTHLAQVERFRAAFQPGQAPAGGAGVAPECEPMMRQAQKISGLPVMSGSRVDLIDESARMVERLSADIDAAKRRVHLLYYIFAPDDTGKRIADALLRARGRGVECRVLVDAVAGRAFFHRRGLAGPLKAAGVKVAAAMPVASISRRLPRMDLRNHRKLAIIDDAIAYNGSHNLINPDYGGRHGGPWYDLTGRYTGPIVDELAAVFAEDWAFESGEILDNPSTPPPPDADRCSPMQVVPTGPSSPGDTFRRVLLAAIQSARSQLILTTPYFVPDEPTLVSLMMAADRGVDVKLLLPAVPDHFFTAAAGRAHFARLLGSGVSIHLYTPGLLHSKTTSVDDAFCLFGSANLDVRSFNLNFELTVVLYGSEITRRLRDVQLKYLSQCTPLDAAQWAARPGLYRYTDSAISLLSPLL